MIPRRSPAAAWRARKGWQESRPEPVNAERRPRRTDDLPPLVVPAPVADVEEPTRRIGLPRRTPRPAPDSAPPREPRTRSPFRRSTTPDVPPPEPVEPEESSPSLRERLVPVAIVAKRMGAGVGAGARRAGAGVGVGATRAGRGVGVGAKRAGAGVGGGATRVAARSRSAAAAMPSRVEKGRERVNPVANAAAVLSGRAARGLGIVALLALEFAARGTTYAAAAIYRLGLATRALALAAAEATRRKGPGAGRALESVVTGTGHALVHLVEALVRAGRGVLHTLWRMIPRRSPAAAWRARKGWQESRPEPVNAERRPRRTDDLPPGVRLRNPVEQALGSRVQPEDTRR